MSIQPCAPHGVLVCEHPRDPALPVAVRPCAHHITSTQVELAPPAAERKTLKRAACALAVCLGAACQSYQPAPLQLDARLDLVGARAADAQAHERFIERLGASGQQAPEAFDLTDGASLAEGEVLALFYNADLRTARLTAGVALALKEHAGLWRDPEFGFDAAQVLSPGDDLEYGATLALTLPVSGRLAVERARAGAAYEVELRRLVDAEWTLRAKVRRAWYSWSAAEKRKVLLGDTIEQVARIGSIAARLEAAGSIRKADERLLRIELIGRKAELSAVELEAQQARVHLLGLMGLAPDAAVELEVSSPTLVLPDTTGSASRVVQFNTELAVLRSRHQVAEEALRLAIRKQYPDVGLGAGFGSEDSDSRFLLGFSLPVPLLNRNRSEIAQARASREVSRAAAETALERIVREVRQAELALDSVRKQRSQLTNELAPLLREQSQNIEELASLGDVDAFLLLETVGRQLDAQSRLVSLEQAEGDALVQLTTLLGPDSKTAPIPSDEISLPPSGAQPVDGSIEETSR